MTTQQSEDNTQWEERFDDLVLYEDGLFNTESGWRIKADPKKLKQFIRQEIESARKEGFWQGCSTNNATALNNVLQAAKQETAREIVERLEQEEAEKWEDAVHCSCLAYVTDQIKKEYGIE